MVDQRMKKLLLCVLFLLLAAASFAKSIPIWVLFVLLSIYYLWAYIKFEKVNGAIESQPMTEEEVKPGVLGEYQVDGPGEELSYGMYIYLLGSPVFIDIKEDDLAKDREKYASFIMDNSTTLEKQISGIKRTHASLKDSSISSIGLHSRDVQQGEVFWSSGEYSILRGLEFVVDK